MGCAKDGDYVIDWNKPIKFLDPRHAVAGVPKFVGRCPDGHALVSFGGNGQTHYRNDGYLNGWSEKMREGTHYGFSYKLGNEDDPEEIDVDPRQEQFDKMTFGEVVKDLSDNIHCALHDKKYCEICLNSAHGMFDECQPGLWTTKMKDYDGLDTSGQVTYQVIKEIWPN